MAPFLFDTSAARAVGGARLQEARSRGFELLLSPITFWELVCHVGEEPFGRSRGNVRKAGLFTLLHDPLAEIAGDVGCPQAANPTRFEDRGAILAVLDALDRAETYAELATLNINVGGNGRSIGDIAVNTQAVFDAERAMFVAALRKDCAKLIRLYGRANAAALSGEQFARMTTTLADGLREDMAAAGCDVRIAAIALRTMLGAGYRLARACRYLTNGAEVDDIAFDGNDLEDYFISLHLGVDSGRVLVTNDEGTRTAIDRTLAAFRECAMVSNIQFKTTSEVLTSDQFLARVAVR